MVSRISPRYWRPANRNITDHRGAHTLGDEPLVHGHPLLAICVDGWIRRSADGSEIESNKVGINVVAATGGGGGGGGAPHDAVMIVEESSGSTKFHRCRQQLQSALYWRVTVALCVGAVVHFPCYLSASDH